MKLKIKLVDIALPVPSYQTKGSAAFDLYSRKTMTIKPFTATVVPLNVVIKIPKGYVLFLALRSSVPLRKGLFIPNGVGVIDQDYHGEEDEIGLEVMNSMKNNITVEKGERIAQALIMPIEKVSFQVVRTMKSKSRGGFGSTGRK